MDARDLRVFEAVARNSGMNRAARELNTVQSNVTMRIRSLETELGIDLFERHSKGMRLTEAGSRLLPHAVEVQAALESAKRAALDDGVPKGALTIGSLETTAAMHLTGMLSSYVSDFPDVDVSLRTGTTVDLVDQVLNYKLEGAFVYGPMEHPDLLSERVYGDELVVLSAPSVTSLKDLSSKETKMIVLRSGCLYRRRLEAILSEHSLVGLRTLEFGTLETIFGCVNAGLGVTLLPKGILKSMWHGKQIGVHKVPSSLRDVQTIFVRRRDGFVSSALKTFLNSVRTFAKRP